MTEKPELRERAKAAAESLASLAGEAATDPALRARLDAALRALSDEPAAAEHAALLADPRDARAFVRDVIAEELERYWERRFGRKL